MPKLIHTALGVYSGGEGEVPTSRAFLFFFSFFVAPTEQSIEHGLTLNAPQKVFWW